MSPTRPDILLIMTDQQRFDSLSCYGCRAIETPHLDRLAAEGVRFEHACCNNPICTPSRASLMTGRPVPDHGVCRLYDDLPDDSVMLPDRLRRLGYDTALVGKLHVSSRSTEARRRHPHDGFDIYDWCLDPAIELESPHNAYARWLGERCPDVLDRLRRAGKRAGSVSRACHMTHWAAERTIALLREPRDRPRFVMMSLFDPHDPFDDHPPAYADRVDREALGPPQPVGDAAATPLMRRIAERTAGWLTTESPAESVTEGRVGYHASVAMLDDEIGRVLDALDRTGRSRDTIVVFVSDHGDMLGDQGMFTKGGYLFDPCVRVPMLIRWPERLRAGVSRRMVQPHDLAASLLLAAGADAEDVAHWMPHARDVIGAEIHDRPAGGDDDFAVCCYPNSAMARRVAGGEPRGGYMDPPLEAVMFRTRRRKLVRYRLGGAEPETEWHLFDLEADPLERHNLWHDPAWHAAGASLRERLERWLTDHPLPTEPMAA